MLPSCVDTRLRVLLPVLLQIINHIVLSNSSIISLTPSTVVAMASTASPCESCGRPPKIPCFDLIPPENFYPEPVWLNTSQHPAPGTDCHATNTTNITGTTVAATATIPSVHETMSPSIDTSIRPSADLSSTVSSETSGEGGLKTGYIVLIIISVIVFMAVVIFSVTVIVYRCKKKHRMAITPEECPGKDTPDNFLHNKNVMGVKYKSTENRSSKMNVVDPPNEVKLQNNSNNNAGWETTALGSQSSMTPVGEPEHEKAPAEYKSPHSDQIIVNKSYTLNEAEDKSMDVNSEPKLKKRTKKKSKKRGGRSLELPGMVPKTIDPDKRRALPPLKLSTREG